LQATANGSGNGATHVERSPAATEPERQEEPHPVPEKPAQEKNAATILAEFPITGLVDGWYFRQKEISPGYYVVDGIDLWGRAVSRGGTDPDALLADCAVDAKYINSQLKRGS
jgi:hypothetical protein